MRIAHVCAYSWAIGGPPKVIYDHTEVALVEGHQVDILSPYSEGEDPYPVPKGGRLLRFKRSSPISRGFREFSLPLFQYLRRHINDYDIVHCHGLWHWGTLAPFLLNPKRVATVVTVHGVLDPWVYAHSRWKKRLFDALFQKRFLRRANLIHVITEDEQADVARYLGKPHPNVVLIPNGVKMSDFVTMPPKGTFRQAFEIAPEKQIVLFMSRLNTKKGLDLLLPAFLKYASEQADAILILAGSDDGYKQLAQQFVDKNKLGDRIKLVGMLTGDLKKAALVDADVFTLPSYSEGFSMACLEAMAARTPALVSDRVGFAATIRHYDAAEVVDLNVESVYRGLKKLLGDAQRRAEIQMNAHRLVTEQYDIDQLSRRLLIEYRAIVQAK